jgi:hypothetical protein
MLPTHLTPHHDDVRILEENLHAFLTSGQKGAVSSTFRTLYTKGKRLRGWAGLRAALTRTLAVQLQVSHITDSTTLNYVILNNQHA